ncbi:MAG TPA: glycerophosphoryl diester phosphodiesterase membrane domain-containing protein [Candidatus Polarisedimenticolia bacterium]|nr:glycerophosphoryl diester phosphodiesterase membrane domain-containing protein [Candidatus Polarisedimenticolia bacterium]
MTDPAPEPIVEIRPLNIGELLDNTFRLYRAHLGLFVGIMAGPTLVISFAAVLVVLMQRDALVLMQPTQDPLEQLKATGSIIIGALVLGGLSAIAYLVAGAATSVAVSRLYLGHAASVRQSYEAIKSSTGRLIWMAIALLLIYLGAIVAVGIVAGVFAIPAAFISPLLSVAVIFLFGAGGFVVIAFILLGRLAVACPALILENLPVGRAFSRSVTLTRGHLLRALLIYVLMMVMGYISAFIFQGPFFLIGWLLTEGPLPPAWTQVLGALSGGVGGMLVGPLSRIALTLLYYDLRVRKEGFDLQLMMARLEGGVAPERP